MALRLLRRMKLVRERPLTRGQNLFISILIALFVLSFFVGAWEYFGTT